MVSVRFGADVRGPNALNSQEASDLTAVDACDSLRCTACFTPPITAYSLAEYLAYSNDRLSRATARKATDTNRTPVVLTINKKL